MPLEAIVFRNSRNQELVGVMHHGEGESPRACIILCHGYAGTKIGGSRRSVEFARLAAKHNISVFRFDFAGSGDSDGDLADLTLDGEIDDLQCAVSAVSSVKGIDTKRIGLVGHCMGAVTVVRTAARDPRVHRTVAWAPFTNLDIAVKGTIGEYAYETIKEGEETEFIYNEQVFTCGPKILTDSSGFDLQEELKRIKTPIQLIHGTEDALVPCEEIEAIMSEVQNTEVEKKLVVLEGAHHSFPYHKMELFNLTIEWFKN